MNRYATFAAILACTLLSACSYNEHMQKADSDFYSAQKEAKKPLFELRAQPGQTIQISGVESLTVNDPRASEIRQVQRHESPGWKLLGTIERVIGIGASVYGQKIQGDSLVDLAGVVASSAGDRSQHFDYSDHSATDNSISIADSYNAQGDTISDSGNVSDSNNGNAGRDIVGRDVIDNSGNIGEGNRQGSDGPIDDDSGDCRDGSCNPTEPGE